MRPIKFRAWDKIHKEMLYDVLEIEQGGFSFKTELEETRPINKGRDFVWQQFTGLLDKNGKEIYEGDILKTQIGKYVWHYQARCYTEFDGNIYGDTVYRNFRSVENEYSENDYEFGEFYVNDKTRKHLNDGYLEIIGNIYENKDLLNA